MVARKETAGSSEGQELELRGLWLAAFLPACASLMAQTLMVWTTLPMKWRKAVKNLSSKSSRRGQSPEIWAKKTIYKSEIFRDDPTTLALIHMHPHESAEMWQFLLWRRWGPERRGRREIPDCEWLTDAKQWGGDSPSSWLRTARTAQISKTWGLAPTLWYLHPASLMLRFAQALLTAGAGKQPGKGCRCLNYRARSTSLFEGLIWVSPTLSPNKRCQTSSLTWPKQ